MGLQLGWVGFWVQVWAWGLIVIYQYCISLLRDIGFRGAIWSNEINRLVMIPCEDSPGGMRARQDHNKMRYGSRFQIGSGNIGYVFEVSGLSLYQLY